MINNIRESNFDEYVEWYLQREYRKGTLNNANGVPESAPVRLEFLQNEHKGKYKGWFKSANWSIVELYDLPDIESLICLDCKWTELSGLTLDRKLPNYRLLRTYMNNAIASDYFTLDPGSPQELLKRRHYLDELSSPDYLFNGDNRIVLCSPEINEATDNPSGTYYLHDGIGRMLTYLYLIYTGAKIFAPVEAFLAIRTAPH